MRLGQGTYTTTIRGELVKIVINEGGIRIENAPLAILGNTLNARAGEFCEKGRSRVDLIARRYRQELSIHGVHNDRELGALQLKTVPRNILVTAKDADLKEILLGKKQSEH